MKIMPICILDAIFKKKDNTICRPKSDIYGEYRSLDAAKLACKDDQECGKIYDPGCNGRTFKLCKKNAEEKVSKKGSCIYGLRREIGGNYITS